MTARLSQLRRVELGVRRRQHIGVEVAFDQPQREFNMRLAPVGLMNTIFAGFVRDEFQARFVVSASACKTRSGRRKSVSSNSWTPRNRSGGGSPPLTRDAYDRRSGARSPRVAVWSEPHCCDGRALVKVQAEETSELISIRYICRPPE